MSIIEKMTGADPMDNLDAYESEIERLHRLHLERTKLTRKVIGDRDAWREVARKSADEVIRLRLQVKELEAAIHPGKQSCDCCIRQHYKGETFWMIECQCGNHDDLGRAQAWCSMANSYEGATGNRI